jgi:hypothetical protein
MQWFIGRGVSLVALAMLAGCASIVSKSDYSVTFRSQPSEADLLIKDKNGHEIYRGKTPATLSLSASSGYFQGARYEVEVSREGYHPRRTTLTPAMDGWYIGNIVFGGLIGMLIVDPVTGAMFRLPSDLTVTLTEKMAAGRHGFHILALNAVPQHLHRELIPLNE